MPIYQANHTKLSALLNSCAEDANILIPNLQRPYVWMPDQVIRLVDSLLRGWPFSTLLLWNLGSVEQHQTLIPSRPFWRVIDRTGENGAEKFSTAEKPSEFKMVLDGQQRIQSLLIVFGAESAGMRLLDADWKTSLTGTHNLRGPLAKKRWTTGRVYLDLNELEKNLVQSRWGMPNLKQDADFSTMLIWAYNSADPKSRFITTSGASYDPPLPDVKANPGRYISMAKIWKLSVGLASRGHDDRMILCEGLLKSHGVEEDRLNRLLAGVEQFAVKLSQAQDQNVNFLELGTLSTSGYIDQHAYNDAIVNIFTRLNSGGRTLTREEITFAWIKVSWDAKRATKFGSAEEAITKLSNVCVQADSGLNLAPDEIVKALSFIWSVFGIDRKGALVRDRDLLDGATVRSMADWLYDEMDAVNKAFEVTMDTLAEQGLMFGEVYRSVNALTVLLACATGFELLRKRLQTCTTEELASSIAMQLFLRSTSQPWFVLSQWAGEWTKGTDETMAAYAKALSEKWSALERETLLAEAQRSWSAVFRPSFQILQPKAAAYIKSLEFEERGQVRGYRLPLWLWNRLNDARAEYSGLVLRDHTKGKTSVEVDHIVSWNLWEQAFVNNADVLKVANRLGNCTLLEKTFNISKGKESLETWLNKIADFPSAEWKSSLKIPELMANVKTPIDKWEEELATAIDLRTTLIKDEIIAYVMDKNLISDHSEAPNE